MTSQSPVAVLLAAGKGTRMKSTRAKALFPLCGLPLVTYPVRAARAAGCGRVVLVVGHQADAVKQAVGEDVEYAVQQPQLGTGDALRAAEGALAGYEGPVLVHCVDVPLLPAALMAELLRTHADSGASATVLTTVVPDAGSYGRIVRDGGAFMKIVEARDATPEQKKIREINAGTYVFQAPDVFRILRALTPDNDQGEYYLTDVLTVLLQEGKTVGTLSAPDSALVEGINDRAQLAEAETRLRAAIRMRHMLAGVTLLDPPSTIIDEDVEIGRDTTVGPFTLIGAGTRIGENCTIGPFSQLYGAIVEDGASVDSSRVEGSLIRAGAKVGPFSRLRSGCEVGPGAEVGNFSEMKKTRVGARSKVHHLGYLGDTTLGEGVNIGAGTITCNYDGKKKHPTAIGDGVFIGSGTLIVAPITIGPDALTGAGAVVTKDIPEGKVAYGVPARVVKDREK